MELKDLCEKIAGMAPFEAEVYAVRSKTFSVEVRSQNVESVNKGTSMGVALRLKDGNRTGFSYQNGSDPDTLIRSASENLRFSPVTALSGFAEAADTDFPVMPFDGSIAKTPDSEKIDIAKRIESAAYAFDKRIINTEAASYGDEEIEVHITTSRGFSYGYKKTACSGSMQAISRQSEQSEEGYCLRQSAELKRLDPEEIGKKAAANAVELLGGRLIRSQALPVILSPLTGALFLAAAAPMFSAENARKGKSLFAGKTGQRCGSGILSVTDDALLAKGLASRPFDDEGTPSKKNEIIKGGVLAGFLHDLDSAARFDKAPSGNAVRPSFKTPPLIGTSNFYIGQGELSAEKMTGSLEKGIYITRVMALHSLNPVSGDFSLGAAGIMIENGKKTYPVRGITIAGNLAEMFMSIRAAGADLEFFPETGHCGSPSLLIDKLSISGE